jgi:site-specific recombinase XerD
MEEGEHPDLARWPALAAEPQGAAWLTDQIQLGLAPNTVLAYARALNEYLDHCHREGLDPLVATRADVAGYVRELAPRPNRRGSNITAIDSGVGLANATLRQRLVAVRQFYDFLIDDGVRQTNPVGRGRYTPGKAFGGTQPRALVPRFTKLPWIPSQEQWVAILGVAKEEPLRNRLMLAFAYDAALRREELCSLHTEDIDPSHRMLRIRAETTKTRRERVVPYAASTGMLLQQYLAWRRHLSIARGPLFLSESRRNRAQPISLWTWSKVVQHIAQRADVLRFTTHTLRHLCLTDLARCGWELHMLAGFAGHRSTASTLQYIHLSGRDLSAKLAAGMAERHAQRVTSLTAPTVGARQ